MSNPSTDRQTLKKLKGHTGWVNALVLIQDGTLVSCSRDETIRLWNTTTGELFKTLTGHTDCVNAVVVTFIPDFLSCCNDSLPVNIYRFLMIVFTESS